MPSFATRGAPGLAVDKFQPQLDSGIAYFPGLQDTLGQAAEVVSEPFSQELLARETYWDLRSSLPVRQWREPNRPWLSWRFRPHLSFRGTSFVLVPDSLQVSWSGGPYVKAAARGQYCLALALLPDSGQFLSIFRTKPFLARDTFVLSSSEGRLRFERRWPDPVLEGPFLIGRPAVPDTGMAILRGLLWEGDSLGNLVSAREEWEPLARPLELLVAGGARVRAKEPLAVTVFTDGTRVQGLRARAQGVTLFRGGDAWGFAADSLAEFDGHGKPLGEIRRLGKSRRPEALPPREGRVAVRLGTHFLKVDRWRPDGQDPFPDLMPSGSLRPVPPGIYDLAGNAEEWCTDSDVGDDEVGGIYFRCRKSGASDGQVRNSFNAKQGFRCVEE